MKKSNRLGFVNSFELSEILLCIIEPLCFIVSWIIPFFNGGSLYFVGTGLVQSLGASVASRSREPTAQALSQVYFIDVAVHVAGFIAWHAIGPNNPGADMIAKVIYDGANTSLTLVKILAVLTGVYMQGQMGWPSLFPFVKSKRLIPGTKVHDRVVFLLILACCTYGTWLTFADIKVTFVAWIVPLVIALLAKRNMMQAILVQSVSAESLQFAAEFQACSPNVQEMVRRAMAAAEHGSRNN